MAEDQKATDLAPPEEQKIRYGLVNTAINFLLNPGVINKPTVHKTAFLKKKGLTDAEVSLAYKEAERDPRHDEILRNSKASNSTPLPPPVPVYYNKSVSFWSQISRFSSSVIVLGVAIFGAHYIYKTYLEPLLFGDSEKKKSQNLERQLFEMANSLSQLETHVLSLEESIKSQKGQMDKFFQSEVNEYYPTPLALRELKTEIASVKSLLLNRHQFPALPKVTPTIPRWQLPSKENGDDTAKQDGSSSEHQYSEEHKSSESKSSYEIHSEDDDALVKQNGNSNEHQYADEHKNSETKSSHEIHSEDDDATEQTEQKEKPEAKSLPSELFGKID